LARGLGAGRRALGLVFLRTVLALAMEGLAHRCIAPFALWSG